MGINSTWGQWPSVQLILMRLAITMYLAKCFTYLGKLTDSAIEIVLKSKLICHSPIAIRGNVGIAAFSQDLGDVVLWTDFVSNR
jgi:hypothetical protein